MAAYVADGATSHAGYIITFLNSHFDDNIKSLDKIRDVVKDVKEQKDTLEKRLSQVSKEVPIEIKKAITTAESVTAKIVAIGEEKETLQHEVLDLVHELQPMVEELSRLTSQLQELEKHSKYLAFVARVEELSSEMQSCLLTESLQPALESFHALTALYDELQDSKCKHLLSFMTDTILFWNQILRDRVADEFEEVLKVMRWPTVPTTMKAPPVSNYSELKTRLQRLFKKLLHLQLPDSISVETLPSNPLLQKIPGMRPLLLPLQLMVKPLKKRFRYHFYGKRRTNSIDKPEWYFTQVLNWIRDHWDFLAQNIQPLLDETEYKEICANTEFMRGMVMLVMEKLADDLPRLLYNDVVFSHTVDEVLLFDRELRSTHGYPPTLPGCLDLLTTPEALSKWLAVEKKFAVEKVERMLESPTAWESQYKDIVDVDEVKVPECAESFMTLLYTITDRYKPLPDPVAKVQFLGLQLELLEDFRIRLVQVMKDAAPAPTAHTHTAVLNAIHYIVQVLKEWSEMVFFLQIQYFRTNHTRLVQENLRESHEKKTSCISPPKYGISSPVNTSQSSDALALELENLPSLHTTVFEDIVDLFESIMNDMLKNIVSYVFTDVQARSQPYRKDKWLALSSQKDLVTTLGLSTSACEMLLVLKDHLCLVEQRLSRPLFVKFWQRLAARLNSFIYNEVILANHYSEGGAMQLQFDMVRNLFPLFGEYTQKPESYFREVREACTLLTLKTGSAILLKETLYSALHEPSRDASLQQTDPKAALRDIGVFTLTPEQAESVLSLRTHLSVT
ncbi:RAD50-interacting protein 1-like [Pomacea canaliculata]|uniref:RAD50-interacting protein 1-like n=1 Tax=Pomacea canaliculata TaxID=400727 RepID=UPI000D7261F3|nr:RAD50-interacting protein 1-like [Pomacea canaliculata]